MGEQRRGEKRGETGRAFSEGSRRAGLEARSAEVTFLIGRKEQGGKAALLWPTPTTTSSRGNIIGETTWGLFTKHTKAVTADIGKMVPFLPDSRPCVLSPKGPGQCRHHQSSQDTFAQEGGPVCGPKSPRKNSPSPLARTPTAWLGIFRKRTPCLCPEMIRERGTGSQS